jgi:hypothetical protein
LKLGRDGHLVVVYCDLSCAADASAVAPTLQSALSRQKSRWWSGDVRQGASPKETVPLIKLPMLVNDVRLRNLFLLRSPRVSGFLQSKGQTAFAGRSHPDELGTA